MVEDSKESKSGSNIGKKAKELAGDKTLRGFALGVGATALAYYALPKLGKQLGPLAVKVVQETLKLSQQTAYGVANLKENLEDIVAEAQEKNEKEFEAQMEMELSKADQNSISEIDEKKEKK